MKVTVAELRAELKVALQDCTHVNDGSLAAQVDENISWAWDNWDDEILKEFYTGEKPEFYNSEFKDNWIDNEDFDTELKFINDPEN